MKGGHETLGDANLGLEFVTTPMRKAIAKSDFLSSLSKSKSLLNKRFNSQMNDLSIYDSQIRKTLEELASLPYDSASMFDTVPSHNRGSGIGTKEGARSFLVGSINQLRDSLDNTLTTLSANLASFREEYLGAESAYELPLEVRVLGACPGCRMVYSKWPGPKCLVCGRTIRRQKDVLIIHLLDGPMRDYIRRNVWLEDAVAKEVRRAGFSNVVAGGSFRGRSGVWHETDVVAVRNGQVLVCECTVSGVDLDKVSSVLRITTDLSAHRGLLVTPGEVPNDAQKFARAYNISTVGTVVDRPSGLKRAVFDVYKYFD